MVSKILIPLLLFFAAIFLIISDKFILTSRPLNSNNQNSNKIIQKKDSFKFSPPSLEQIFKKDHSWIATLSAERKRVVIATGDVIPARSVNFKAVSLNNFKWPYENIAEVLKSADITFINLEAPLLNYCLPAQEGMIFCGTSKNIEGLVYSGVDIASLANNHAGNYGEKGVLETVSILLKNGISVTGINGPLIRDVKGLKIAFLGYNDISKPQPGVSNFDEQKIKSEISEARKQVDIVVVTYHWGVEYRDQPDERQKYLAHLTIDSGADLVIGNHPHWIQPIEIYKGKLIAYAHGNLVFDQEWSQKTKEGIIGIYTFYDNSLVDVEYLPISIQNYGQPKFLEGEEKKQILNRIWIESDKLKYGK